MIRSGHLQTSDSDSTKRAMFQKRLEESKYNADAVRNIGNMKEGKGNMRQINGNSPE